ncbi:MAG: helix-turn-helix domain-containing protein [Thermoanaerobaculia bacterium]|nr:helix-turn-helix domain-containing protein [Thermoanaerobaculia bacterium]
MGRLPRVRREQVLAAAREVFSERGFDAATLAAIAGRLGVSPAALLRHEPSKAALFAAAMAPSREGIRLPITFLAELEGTEDPATVLRRLGRAFVPFIEARLDEQIARWMHAKTVEEARGFQPPFDPTVRPTPPEIAHGLVEAWLTRATAAGRLRVGDPRAAALALLGSFHAYVMLHRVVPMMDPPLPLERYLDTLVELWTGSGAAGQGPSS